MKPSSNHLLDAHAASTAPSDRVNGALAAGRAVHSIQQQATCQTTPLEVSVPLFARKVVSQRANAWFFHDAASVSRFFSANKYTCFLHEGKEHIVVESLSSLEVRLAPLGFMRSHRADLINLSHVRCIKRVNQSFEINLKDGQCVTASRRLVQTLRLRLGF